MHMELRKQFWKSGRNMSCMCWTVYKWQYNNYLNDYEHLSGIRFLYHEIVQNRACNFNIIIVWYCILQQRWINCVLKYVDLIENEVNCVWTLPAKIFFSTMFLTLLVCTYSYLGNMCLSKVHWGIPRNGAHYVIKTS